MPTSCASVTRVCRKLCEDAQVIDLGAIPTSVGERDGWRQLALTVGAYRDRYGATDARATSGPLASPSASTPGRALSQPKPCGSTRAQARSTGGHSHRSRPRLARPANVRVRWDGDAMTRLVLNELARWVRAIGALSASFALITLVPNLLPAEERGVAQSAGGEVLSVVWVTACGTRLAPLASDDIRAALQPAHDRRAFERLQDLRIRSGLPDHALMCILRAV